MSGFRTFSPWISGGQPPLPWQAEADAEKRLCAARQQLRAEQETGARGVVAPGVAQHGCHG